MVMTVVMTIWASRRADRIALQPSEVKPIPSGRSVTWINESGSSDVQPPFK